MNDDPSSARFISAFGRDVDIPETKLAFNPETRHLTLEGGNRKDAAASSALADVIDVLDQAIEPLSGRAVETALAGTDHTRDAIRRALSLGIRTGAIVAEPGPKRSTLHSRPAPSAPVRRSAPSVRQRSARECASAPIEGRTGTHAPQTPSAPTNNHDPITDLIDRAAADGRLTREEESA